MLGLFGPSRGLLFGFPYWRSHGGCWITLHCHRRTSIRRGASTKECDWLCDQGGTLPRVDSLPGRTQNCSLSGWAARGLGDLCSLLLDSAGPEPGVRLSFARRATLATTFICWALWLRISLSCFKVSYCSILQRFKAGCLFRSGPCRRGLLEAHAAVRLVHIGI